MHKQNIYKYMRIPWGLMQHFMFEAFGVILIRSIGWSHLDSQKLITSILCNFYFEKVVINFLTKLKTTESDKYWIARFAHFMTSLKLMDSLLICISYVCSDALCYILLVKTTMHFIKQWIAEWSTFILLQ